MSIVANNNILYIYYLQDFCISANRKFAVWKNCKAGIKIYFLLQKIETCLNCGVRQVYKFNTFQIFFCKISTCVTLLNQ